MENDLCKETRGPAFLKTEFLVLAICEKFKLLEMLKFCL